MPSNLNAFNLFLLYWVIQNQSFWMHSILNAFNFECIQVLCSIRPSMAIQFFRTIKLSRPIQFFFTLSNGNGIRIPHGKVAINITNHIKMIIEKSRELPHQILTGWCGHIYYVQIYQPTKPLLTTIHLIIVFTNTNLMHR